MRFRICRLAALNVAAAALVAVWAAYWQVIRGPELAYDSQNPRVLLAEERKPRGALLDRRGRPLAVTVWREGRPRRVYPQGEVFSHPVGYRSLRLGKTGLEGALDAVLLGVGEAAPWWRELDRRLGRGPRRLDVVTTLDAQLQSFAWRLLGAAAGAVVVLDVHTGGVLVSVSRPGFDPNRLEEAWAQLSRAPSSPLLDRALLGVYPPGTIFQLVVLAAALSRDLVLLDGPAACSTGATSHQEVLWRHALAFPCKQAFGELAQSVGPRPLREVAEAFGLGSPPPVELAAAAGYLPEGKDLDLPRLRALGTGEGVLLSPLQAAVVAATLARDGERPHPHFILALRSDDGSTVARQVPSATRILAREVARGLQQALKEVSSHLDLHVPKSAGGALGLADAAPGRPGWFVGYGPGNSPRVAIAVVVEQGDAKAAVQVARMLFSQALPMVR